MHISGKQVALVAVGFAAAGALAPVAVQAATKGQVVIVAPDHHVKGQAEVTNGRLDVTTRGLTTLSAGARPIDKEVELHTYPGSLDHYAELSDLPAHRSLSIGTLTVAASADPGLTTPVATELTLLHGDCSKSTYYRFFDYLSLPSASTATETFPIPQLIPASDEEHCLAVHIASNNPPQDVYVTLVGNED
jgi:hypothetical protein